MSLIQSLRCARYGSEAKTGDGQKVVFSRHVLSPVPSREADGNTLSGFIASSTNSTFFSSHCHRDTYKELLNWQTKKKTEKKTDIPISFPVRFYFFFVCLFLTDQRCLAKLNIAL